LVRRFRSRQVISVRIVATGTPPELSLVEPPHQVPAPRVVVAPSAQGAFSEYAQGAVLHALVDSGWDPSAEDDAYQFTVRPTRDLSLTITEPTREVPPYLDLREGDLLPYTWEVAGS